MNNSGYVIAADTSTVYLYLSAAKIHDGRPEEVQTQILQPDKDMPDWFSVYFQNFIKPYKKDISVLAVGAGPGSFTGLRISFAYLRTYAMLLKTPLVSFPSGKLWHSALCEKDEILLTQLNRDLYSGYGPDVKSPQSVKNWIDYFNTNPNQTGAVWNNATYMNRTDIKIAWPSRLKTVSYRDKKPAFPLSELPQKADWNALPDYGHNIQLKMKDSLRS